MYDWQKKFNEEYKTLDEWKREVETIRQAERPLLYITQDQLYVGYTSGTWPRSFVLAYPK